MLPLEGMLFIPSLVVVPLALAALFFLRRHEAYPWLWRRAVIACVVLCGLFAMQVLSTPLYSERDRSPDNPGGPSSGVFAVIVVFLLGTCVVIPAFPVLVALAALPPRGWSPRTRLLLVAMSLLFIGTLAGLMARKNAAFIADYEQAQQQGRLERIQWRQQRTRP